MGVLFSASKASIGAAWGSFYSFGGNFFVSVY